MAIKLIGLAGPARSGKSSMAKFLVDLLAYDTYSLAGPLKILIATLFDWDEPFIEGDAKDRVREVGLNRLEFVKKWAELRMTQATGQSMTTELFNDKLIPLLFSDDEAKDGPFISPRRAWQLFGTEFARGLNPRVWLDLAGLALKDAKAADSGLIVTDVRFPNEHKWNHDTNGLTVHVRRAGAEFQIEDTGHESELPLKKASVDWATPVCADLAQLEKSAEMIAQFVKVAPTTDVRLSPRMPTFETLYEGRM